MNPQVCPSQEVRAIDDRESDWLRASEPFCDFERTAGQFSGAGYAILIDEPFREHFSFPSLEPSQEDRKHFQRAAAEWRNDTRHLSRVSKMIEHPAYRDIIAMGERAIPLLLEEVQKDPPDLWFWALSEITGEDPIDPSHHGDIKAMASDWIEWGKAGGYIRH